MKQPFFPSATTLLSFVPTIPMLRYKFKKYFQDVEWHGKDFRAIRDRKQDPGRGSNQ